MSFAINLNPIGAISSVYGAPQLKIRYPIGAAPTADYYIPDSLEEDFPLLISEYQKQYNSAIKQERMRIPQQNLKEYEVLQRRLNNADPSDYEEAKRDSAQLQPLLMTPSEVWQLIKQYRPDIIARLPANPFSKEVPVFEQSNFEMVGHFKKEIESEFSREMTDDEKRAQVLHFVDAKGTKQPTKAQILVVNATGKKISPETFWRMLNSKVNEDVRRRIWGVILHECLHRLVAEINPYIQISDWVEPIKIEIKSLEGEFEVTTRGQADMNENLMSAKETLYQDSLGILKSPKSSFEMGKKPFKVEIQRRNKNCWWFWSTYQKDMTSMADEYNGLVDSGRDREERIHLLDQMELRTRKIMRWFPQVIEKLHELAYWAQNLVVSSMAPMILIYNYPVHASTISREDIAVKDDFLMEMKELESKEHEAKERLKTVEGLYKNITELRQGKAVKRLELPEGFRGEWGTLSGLTQAFALAA